MPTLSQLKQVAEIETRYTVSGEADVRRAMDGVASAQDRVANGAQAVAVATETVERKQLSLAKAADSLRAKHDEVFRAQQRQQADLGRISRYEAAGQYDPTVAESLRANVLAKYGNDNRKSADGGLSSYDKSFIRYQGFDVASSLGAGASPLTVAFQQGPQVLQQLADREGGLSAGLKQLGVTVGGLVTPFTVAAAAGTALGAAFLYAGYQASKEQDLLEKATLGFGRTTGATTSTLDALAKANAEAGKVSTGTAREMAAGYASTGQIALPVFADLIQSTERYARLTGQDTVSATRDLASAFSDLTSGADAIAAKIGGLDDKTRQLITTQIEHGDKTGAQATAADYLRSTVEANTTATSGWAAAWDKAKIAADGYWESAKRIAGIKLGVAPEGAQEAADRLTKQVDYANEFRKRGGLAPLGLGDPAIAERDAARLVADSEAREARARAAEERANKASTMAGGIGREFDPLYSQYRGLIQKKSDLDAALNDPLARSKLADVDQVRQAADGYDRAIKTMVDADGKLVTSAERARQQDQLRLDAINATTAAEKVAVAERQKAFDLAGKPLSALDAGVQITRSGVLARAEADSKGKSGSDSTDEYDRATKSLDDRIRRQGEEAATYGQTADAVARYRAEQDLLVAAKRAERDLTPTLLADIRTHADAASDAAKRLEDARETSRRTDDYRSIGSDGVRTLARDLADGATAGKILTDVLGSLKSRIADLAANSISDALFGRRGSSDLGLLGGLFGGAGSASSTSGGLGGLISGLFHHEGGLVGRDGVPRLMPADAWNAAPRYHDGFRPDEVPAVLQRGEWVLSRDDVAQIRQGGAAVASTNAPPSITFVTPPGMNLEADGPPQRRADGSYEQVLKTVEKGLAGRARNSRGPFQQAMGGAWSRDG